MEVLNLTSVLNNFHSEQQAVHHGTHPFEKTETEEETKAAVNEKKPEEHKHTATVPKPQTKEI